MLGDRDTDRTEKASDAGAPGGTAPGDEREHLRTAPGLRAWLEWPPAERTYFWGLGEHVFSLYLSSDEAFHFDFEGRLRRAYAGGRHYLRGLDGRLLRKVLAGKRRAGPAETGTFSLSEAAALYRLSHEAVLGALGRLRDGHSGGAQESVSQAQELLERAVEFTPGRLAAEAERFREAYDPIGVLPPDCYRALIVQATLGCRWGKCTFCTIYQDVRHRRKELPEFRQHLRRIKEFFGRALPLRRGVFFGEANALEIPGASLERMLEAVREEFAELVVPGVGGRGGICAFTDAFEGRAHGPGELRRLATLGLGRVYLGLESGDDQILKELRKPASRELALRRVSELKEAGIAVGVIYLAGAGGHQRARQHVEATVELSAELPLGEGDLVYVSPLEGRVPGGLPLASEEIEAQERELLGRLRALGLRASRYDLRSFVYY